MKTLQKGSKGTEVFILQLLLNASSVVKPKIKVDGNFGAKTYHAVIQFQKKKKLSTDGIVGKITWRGMGIKPFAGKFIPPNHVSTTKWMPIAKAEMGIHENSAPGKHNKRIIEYHAVTTLKATTDETPWCSSFVNWVVKQAGYKGTDSALAKSWLDWGKKINKPKEGAIVIIRRKSKRLDAATGSSTGYHVAFFVRKTTTHITLLGGNQRDSVRESNYHLRSYDIKGYRWPNDP